MAAAFRSIASVTYASRANTSVAAPSGIVDGDTLIAGIFVGASGTAPTPTLTGFTQIGSATNVTSAGFNGKLFVFWKRAASESGAYAFSHTTASSQAFVMAVSGNFDGSPVEVNSTNSGTGFTSTANGVTIGSLTDTASATATVSGSVGKTLGALTCSVAATVRGQSSVASTLTGITASATATAPESASVGGSLARDDCCGSRCGDHDSVAGRSDDLGCGYLRERRYRRCYACAANFRRNRAGGERPLRIRRWRGRSNAWPADGDCQHGAFYTKPKRASRAFDLKESGNDCDLRKAAQRRPRPHA